MAAASRRSIPATRTTPPGAIRLRLEQVDASIARYLRMLDTADRQEERVAEMRVTRLSERLEALRRQMQQLKEMEQAIAEAPDHQVSLTDPDARAMATNGKGTGMVGYNVQTVVDAKHHLIVAHEVTNIGHDKHQLANMARQAKEVTGADGLTVLADRGYFSGEASHIANAAATTAEVWWVQGFAKEEDAAFKKMVVEYEKASGNKIDASIIPFAPLGQKEVSAITSGIVPDVMEVYDPEFAPLNAWDDKLVEVGDIVETQ